MLKRRLMAFILAASMVVGNASPALAAESSAPISTDGGTVTMNEDGSMQITSDSQTDIGAEEGADDDVKNLETESSTSEGSGSTDTANKDTGSEGTAGECSAVEGESDGSDTNTDVPIDNADNVQAEEQVPEEESSEGESENEGEEDKKADADDQSKEAVSDNSLSVSGNMVAVSQSYLTTTGNAPIVVTYHTGDSQTADENKREYDSFDEALSRLAADFGSKKGAYTFLFNEDAEITKAVKGIVTFPAFVQEIHFTTGEHTADGQQDGTGSSRYYLRTLDLNGFTLKVSGQVYLTEGLRLVSLGDEGIETASPAKLSATAGVYIDESSLLVKRQGDTDAVWENLDQRTEERPAVLQNVNIDAASTEVVLEAKADKNESQDDNYEYVIEGTITARSLEISEGSWTTGKITAGDLYVAGVSQKIRTGKSDQSTSYWSEQAVLKSPQIIISNGRAVVEGILGSKEAVSPDAGAETRDMGIADLALTLNKSQLSIVSQNVTTDKGAENIAGMVYATEVIVNTGAAYPQEAVKDWTLVNEGTLYAERITMKAGTLYNGSKLLADAMSLVNLENGENAELIVNELAQTAAGRTWLMRDSRMLVNVSGTLNNITLGDHNGNGGEAYLGRSKTGGADGSQASLTLGGSFTVNVEGEALNIFVSDEYKDTANLSAIEIKTDPNTGAQLEEVAENETVFFLAEATTIFPVANLRLIQPNSGASLPTTVYQEGTEIKATEAVISLYAKRVDGEQGENLLIKSFSSLNEALNYLKETGSTNTSYIMELNTVSAGSADLALAFPANVAELEIRGEASGTKLTYKGDLVLTTNMVFANIDFDSTKGAASTINTSGKQLVLEGIKNSEAASEGNTNVPDEAIFAQIVGKASTNLVIKDSKLKTTMAINGLGMVELNNSTLTVEGNVTVVNLLLEGGIVKLEKSVASKTNPVLTVSQQLTLKHKLVEDTYKSPKLDVAGMIKLNAIITYTERAVFHYVNGATTPGLTISGTLTSLGEDGSQVLQDVYAVKKEGTDAGYTITEVQPGEETAQYETIKKNAISIDFESDIPADTALVNAPKVSAVWFVLGKEMSEQKQEDSAAAAVTAKGLTYKTGNLIKSEAALKEYKVLLQQVVWEEVPLINEDTNTEIQTKKVNAVYYDLDGFENLQEAFLEIDRLNYPQNEYRILVKNTDEYQVKGKPANYVFPVKAARVWVEGDNDSQTVQLIYANDITVRTNTSFENIELAPKAASGKLNLGNFEVILSNTKFAQNDDAGQTGKKITVIGGGLTKGSYLKLDTTSSGNTQEMIFAAISNVGTLWMAGVDVTVTGTTNIDTLKMINAGVYRETFTGLNTISIRDVYALGGSRIKTLPAYTYTNSSKTTIKAITPRLTISGRVEIEDYTGPNVLDIDVLLDTETSLELNSDKLAEGFVEKTGIPLAKAVNVDTTFTTYGGDGRGNGAVYKKAGVISYLEQPVFVTLEYNVVEGDDSTRVVTNCGSFKDAVTEINNLRTRRAYRLVFQGIGLTDEGFVLETFTMPNKNYVSHLTLAADGGEVYYKGNLTFTSDVTLEMINFVQATVVAGENTRAEDAAAGNLPAPVTINTGGFNLNLAEGTTEDDGSITLNIVEFNTPILLNGGGKGTFTLHENVQLLAGDTIYFEDSTINSGEFRESQSLIRGKILNFAAVDIDQHVDLLGWPTWNAKTQKEVYNAAEINVTALNISAANWLEVGNDYYADKVTVKNLTLTGSRLEVAGSGTFTNVTLADSNPILSVKAPIPNCTEVDGELVAAALPTCYFSILGTVSNTAYGAVLETGLNVKAESALNISGNVILENSYNNEESRITVKVCVPPEALGEEAMEDEAIKLGETTVTAMISKRKTQKIIGKTLLTARSADERAFLAHQDCVTSSDGKDTTSPYGDDNTDGYLLKKTGAAINVYYGEQIGAALYFKQGESGQSEQLYNYYPTLADAITAIDVLKDTAAEYRIEVLQDVYKAKDEVKGIYTATTLAMPRYAAHVTIMSDITSVGAGSQPAKRLFISGNIVLGCDTTFESLELMLPNNIFTQGKNLELKNMEQYEYTGGYEASNRRNVKDAAFLKVDGGRNGEVTIISDEKTCQFTGGILNVKKLTVENATVCIPSGNLVVTEELSLNNGDVQLVAGAATVKNLKNIGTKANTLAYGRNASNKQPNFTITGEIVHGDGAQKLVFEIADSGKAATTQMAEANSAGTYTLSPAAELVNLDKAAMDMLTFKIKDAQSSIDAVAWANNGVYWLPDALKDKTIAVAWSTEDEASQKAGHTASCLDIAQASAYINSRTDKTASYTIGLPGDISDPMVTDRVAVSVLTLPAKDRADRIILDGQPDQVSTPSILSFSGNITANGAVEFTDIKLANKTNFTITNVKNSDVVQNRKVVEAGAAELTFKNVSYADSISGAPYGKILNLVGVKNSTNVNISGAPLELAGGLTNINALGLESMLTTLGKSNINTLKLLENGAWKAMGVTMIGEVEVSATGAVTDTANYIATTYSLDRTKASTGLPVLTITGSVDKTLPVRIFEPISQKELGVTDEKPAPSEEEKQQAYDGAKLLIATKESADKFVAAPYASYDSSTKNEYIIKSELAAKYKAFKDGKNYVSNGDISGMEVLLTEVPEGGGSYQSYVKTYAEAIQIINTSGDSKTSYILALRKTEGAQLDAEGRKGNQGIVYTAVDKAGNSVEGALTLPAANKAKNLTITSESGSDAITLKFTGAIAPKTNLSFQNIGLTEMKRISGGYEDLNTVNLNAGTSKVEFGQGTKTADAAAKSAEIEETDQSGDTFFALTDLKQTQDYQMIFTSISGTGIAEVKMGVPAVYVERDINVPLWYDDRTDQRAESVIAAGGSIKITDKLYSKDTATEITIKGKKAILLNKIEAVKLDIDTCFTQAAWQRAITQLTINDISLGAEKLAQAKASSINVVPHVYDRETKEYKEISSQQLEELCIIADKNPAAWQKLLISAKGSVADTANTQNSNFAVAGQTYNVVKYEGGIYITKAEYAVEVKADGGKAEVAGRNGQTTEVQVEAYIGKFLSWEQAVKEIERINDKNKSYTITLLNAYKDTDYPILKSVPMPSKASSIVIVGVALDGSETDNGVTGLLTTAGGITLKCDTEFKNMNLAAVKKSGRGYYSMPFTLNAGNFTVKLSGMMEESQYSGVGSFTTQMRLTGGAAGKAKIQPYVEQDKITHDDFLLKLTSLSEVELTNIQGGEATKTAAMDYTVKEGISGVGELTIYPGVTVDCQKADVVLKNLVMGEAKEKQLKSGGTEDNPEDYTYPANTSIASLQAKNITVTQKTAMASSRLKAGTTIVGDGKIILTNVLFADMYNHLEGKQDRFGNSLIQIKGTVETMGENIVPSWSAATVGLTLNNSGKTYAKLAEGMNLLTAPKAASSLFRPHYNYLNAEQKTVERMGPEISDNRYGLYKAGNFIKYGKIKEDATEDNYVAEAKLWIGSSGAEDTYYKRAYSIYMTFEEAVNAINSMGLQKEIEGSNGKMTHADYTIEMLSDAEIGNAKGDGRYSVITLPTKVSELTIFGCGSSIRFSGNVTVRSNTTLESGIILTPMKAIKGGAEPATTNIAAGNFKLTFAGADVGYWNREGEPVSMLNNLSGGARGELIIAPNGGITAVNVTGFNKIVFKGNGSSKTDPSQSQGGKQIVEILEATGKINVKSIFAENYAVATLMNGQGLTANTIGLTGNSEVEIYNSAAIPMKLNGARVDKTYDISAPICSVYRDSTTSATPIKLNLVSRTGTVLDGTRLISGKYLNPSHWKVSMAESGEERNTYLNGNDLYLGSLYIP